MSSSDGSNPTVDGAVNDSATSDAPDAGDDAPSEAGSPITSALGSTGRFELTSTSVIGELYDDGTIVRSPAHPQCVIHVHSRTKPRSNAGGPVVVGGPVVGTEGGPAAPINLMPDPTKQNQYVELVGPVFGDSADYQVQIQGNGSVTFPPLTAQLLRPLPIGTITVAKPVRPDGGPMDVNSTASLEIEWTPPAGVQADHRLIVALANVQKPESPKRAELRCGYPLAAGKATIPKALLTELRERVTPVNATNPQGSMRIWAGGQAEVAGAGQSYVIELGRRDSTSFATGDAPIVLK